MNLLLALLSGCVFGLGLILSGMTDPAKVLGFLDLAGRWDPSLALVMGAALAVAAVAFAYARRRGSTLLGEAVQLPTATRIDRRLILGSLTFGVGWGLAGYCPGPVLASLLSGGPAPWVFGGAMVLGMGVFEILERAMTKASTGKPHP